jgi:hypothetical protein
MVHPERIKNTAVLTAVKLGLEAFTPPRQAMACRPILTASARDGRGDPRSGRRKACGAAELRKVLKRSCEPQQLQPFAVSKVYCSRNRSSWRGSSLGSEAIVW